MLLVVIVALRFCGMRLLVIDDVIDSIKGAFGSSARVQSQGSDDATKSMKKVHEAQPIVMVDVLVQLRHFCGNEKEGRCGAWLRDLPDVLFALKKGPGTWDRKSFPKARALEVDQLLINAASNSEVAALKARTHLRTLALELYAVSGKSTKNELKSPGFFAQVHED